MRIVNACLCAALMACSHSEPLAEGFSQRAYLYQKPAGLDAAVAGYPLERHGAAYLEKEYRHVLGRRYDTSLADGTSALQPDTWSPDGPQYRSYSIYDLQRRERSCGGEGLDRPDILPGVHKSQ